MLLTKETKIYLKDEKNTKEKFSIALEKWQNASHLDNKIAIRNCSSQKSAIETTQILNNNEKIIIRVSRGKNYLNKSTSRKNTKIFVQSIIGNLI